MIAIEVTPQKLIELIQKTNVKRIVGRKIKVNGIYLWNGVFDTYHSETFIDCGDAIELLKEKRRGMYTLEIAPSAIEETIAFVAEISGNN
jgi:hypothetical protein